MFRPPGLLATQVAPTAVPYGTRQPWLVRPSILRFVTSPYIGYASRPNRAIDGVGTSTPQDSRPCRPLPRRALFRGGGSIDVRGHYYVQFPAAFRGTAG